VAVSVREGLGLAERPEVAGLVALLRALVRPHDDLAWAALLCSPWGVRQAAALCRVAAAEGSGWQEKLARSGEAAAMYEAVAAGQEAVGRLPLAEVARSVWVGLEGPRECARRLGQGSLLNCRAALELLGETCAARPRATPEEVLSEFEERLASAYQPPQEECGESAVQMMTVHGAKGLEFDVVFLPFLDWNPLARRELPPYLLERLPDGRHVVALPPDRRAPGEDPVWGLVREFSSERQLGEAKRLFYTAATRARRGLHLSGCAPLKDGCLSPKRCLPLSWLLAAEGLAGAPAEGLSQTTPTGLAVQVDPAPAPLAEAAAPAPAPAQRPTLRPEPLSYRKLSASELAGEQRAEEGAGTLFEPSLEARVRGTLIHRLLEGAAAGEPLPGQGQVAAALRAEGLPHERAAKLSAELLEEARSCLADPFLAAGLAAAERYAELALESLAGGAPGPSRSLEVGIIDLLFRQGEAWWVVDYKTGRPQPGDSVPDFLEAQGGKYRPQMAAYRGLVASWQGVGQERVRLVLYFTALRQAVEV